MTDNSIIPDIDRAIDQIEALMVNGAPAEMPVVHRFVPGMYIREIHIPAGTLLTSMEHKTEHPFVITKGRIRVVSGNEGGQIYEAPFLGITKPGTRRALYCEEDTVWTTFHATDKTTVEEVAEDILEKPQNPLISIDHPNLNQWRRELPKLQTK